MKSYKKQLKEYIADLRRVKTPPKKQRALIEEWKIGYWYNQKSGEDRPYEGKTDPFKVTSGDFAPRHKGKPKRTGFRQPKLTPFEADPEYRDKQEKVHGEADLQGVKQYPVVIRDETVQMKPFEIKSERLRHSVEVLELKVGYDHRTNRQVLYSPLKYNERWDRQSQVVWLRVIGMSPKQIGIKLKIKYDTVKNWLRALKDQPLVATTQYDWAVRQIEGKAELSTRFSSTEAKPRSMEVIK